MSNKLPNADELYRMYHDDGLSAQAIADIYNATQGSVVKKLRRGGYQLRSLSEAHRLAYKSGRHAVHIQSGEDHWAWKGGKEQRRYRGKVHKESCDVCGARQNLCIHHKDFNHYNNDPDNLQVLCVSCHMSLHKKIYWEAVQNGDTPPKSNGPVGWERT